MYWVYALLFFGRWTSILVHARNCRQILLVAYQRRSLTGPSATTESNLNNCIIDPLYTSNATRQNEVAKEIISALQGMQQDKLYCLNIKAEFDPPKPWYDNIDQNSFQDYHFRNFQYDYPGENPQCFELISVVSLERVHKNRIGGENGGPVIDCDWSDINNRIKQAIEGDQKLGPQKSEVTEDATIFEDREGWRKIKGTTNFLVFRLSKPSKHGFLDNDVDCVPLP
ncbi:hypothetical protein BCR37DRAFT_385250 [Protomyces lactucae-debilis]|uniref:Uncharacterized protein n=1 Tax=Protomyces lactucae-debilis TaxID=2754530 RepID=A0A1Y2FU94_PROLT|nr:uncharacterized protein BCR37DRAFT_385250 [Protomyces lactucae-debilis]ORY86766.1 hypothetical protein BCR37DRAFT_385250 [Protomyces lactucae-debilis]